MQGIITNFDFSRFVLRFDVIAQPTEAQEFQSREQEFLKKKKIKLRICVATILQKSEEIKVPWGQPSPNTNCSHN